MAGSRLFCISAKMRETIPIPQLREIATMSEHEKVSLEMPDHDVGGVLAAVADVIDSRKGADPTSSYVAQLFFRAPDGVLKKIGEEAVECVMAAKDKNPRDIIYETADLWFHSLVMLSQYGLRPEQVLAELERREGVSGLEEKRSRGAR